MKLIHWFKATEKLSSRAALAVIFVFWLYRKKTFVFGLDATEKPVFGFGAIEKLYEGQVI